MTTTKRVRHVVFFILVMALLLALIPACAQPAPSTAPALAPAPTPKPAPATTSVPASKPTPTPTATPAAKWPKHIAIASSKPGSSDYVMVVGLAKLITKYVGVEASAAPYETRAAYPKALQAGEIEMGSTSAPNVYGSWAGEFEWEGKPIKQGLVAWAGAPMLTGIMAHPKAKIKTPADLIGKKWMCKLVGSATTKAAYEGIMAAYGITEQNTKLLSRTAKEDIINGLREGTIDAGLSYIMPGEPMVQELKLTGDVEIVSLSDEAISEIVKKRPLFMKMVFPTGTFGQDKPIQSVGFPNLTIFRNDLPDDLVYAITKALFDHFDEYLGVHADAKYTKLPDSIDPGSIVVPMHPGAIKYYKEKGLWTKAHETKQAEVVKRFGLDLKW